MFEYPETKALVPLVRSRTPTENSGMQFPRGNQRIIMQPGAEGHVEDDVDSPNGDVSDGHLTWLAQDIPQKQQIDGNGRGDYGPGRSTKARDAVPERDIRGWEGTDQRFDFRGGDLGGVRRSQRQ